MNLTEILDIEYPIILAPMFLISDANMVKAALDAGITAAIPALNYRTSSQLKAAIQEIKAHTNKPFGINLIVNKSNIYLNKQLEVCLELKVDYIITALGSPMKIIELCKEKGIKVFCDVANVKHAIKAEKMGCDAVIALNNRAGGHLGSLAAEEFIPALQDAISIPIISAGGVATRDQLLDKLNLGAAGCSIGSLFIASSEAPVTMEYKNAIVNYGEKDIIITRKLSGTPCTVINTDYMKSLGNRDGILQKVINSNWKVRKLVRFIVATIGMRKLRKAAFQATYSTIWSAGVSIEDVHEILPIKKIVQKLTKTT